MLRANDWMTRTLDTLILFPVRGDSEGDLEPVIRLEMIYKPDYMLISRAFHTPTAS